MIKTQFEIGNIPALLLGEPSDMVYLFIHGMCGCKEEAIPFYDIASTGGYQVLGIDLPAHGNRSGRGETLVPWIAVPELQSVYRYIKNRWRVCRIRANSIGAWFSTVAFDGYNIEKALFVSPITDMEMLIAGMMERAGVTEKELLEKHDIVTETGDVLSSRYYIYAREHKPKWDVPTGILYAGRDMMTSRETISKYTEMHNASLCVFENGEHWFHTPEQLNILRVWEKENI